MKKRATVTTSLVSLEGCLEGAWEVEVERLSGIVEARNPSIRGCAAQAGTEEEARKRLTALRRAYLRWMDSKNLDLPLPDAPAVGTRTDNSGRTVKFGTENPDG